MTRENVRLIERWFEIQSSHDLEQVVELFADDVIYQDVALGLIKKGPAEVVELMKSLYHSFPDYAVSIVSAVADDTRGGAEMIMSGTNEKENFGMAGTGKPFSIRAAAAMRFSNGKITHWSDYWSVSTFKEQVGLE